MADEIATRQLDFYQVHTSMAELSLTGAQWATMPTLNQYELYLDIML